jgi:hypothetical protein
MIPPEHPEKRPAKFIICHSARRDKIPNRIAQRIRLDSCSPIVSPAIPRLCQILRRSRASPGHPWERIAGSSHPSRIGAEARDLFPPTNGRHCAFNYPSRRRALPIAQQKGTAAHRRSLACRIAVLKCTTTPATNVSRTTTQAQRSVHDPRAALQCGPE